MTEDDELERLMREGLERRAERGGHDGAGGRPGARRCRADAAEPGWSVCAAAAVAAVAVTGVLVDRAGSPGGATGPGRSTNRPARSPTVPWRTEYWRDMRVDVPADWGYGGAPRWRRPGDGRLRCRGHGRPPTGAAPGGGPDDAVRRPADRADRRLRGVPVDRPGRRAAAGALRLARRRRRARDRWTWATAGCRRPSRSTAAGSRSPPRTPALRERILDSAGGGETCMSEVDTRRVDVPASSPRDGPRAPRAPRRSRSAPIRRGGPAAGRHGWAGVRHVGGQAARELPRRPRCCRQLRSDRCPTPTASRPSGCVLELGDAGGRSSGATSCTSVRARASTWTAPASRLRARRADTRPGRAPGRSAGSRRALRPDRRQGRDDRLLHRHRAAECSARPACG